jgi:hypothetical protein
MSVRHELPLQLLGTYVGKGYRIHLYNIESDRRYTVCGRTGLPNPRGMGLGGWGVSADLADCDKCLRLAHEIDNVDGWDFNGIHGNW